MSAEDWEAARRVLGQEPDRDRWAAALYERWFHAITAETCHFPDEGGYRAAHGAGRAAGQGAGFEPGWTLAALGGGGAVEAERGAVRTRALPLDWLPADPARLAAGVGDAIAVRPRIDAVSGGFWHLWSRPWALRPPERILRVYAPVAPHAAEPFVAAFAAAAPAATRWSMKILTGAHGGGRRDGAVIYLDRRHGLAQRWLAALLAAAAPLVAGPRPRCTAALAGGFGWANDPGGGRSYGQWLCERLGGVDPAVIDDAAAFAAAVAARFAADGADADAPHLGPA